MRRAPGLAVALWLLAPRLAAACAACLSSPYGYRTYNWGYVGLLAMPFAVALVIGGVLAWSAGWLSRARLRRLFSLRNATLKETP
jgi:hypothetical protein